MQKVTLSCTVYFSTCTYCSIRFSEQTKAAVILLTVHLSKHFADTRNDDHRFLIDNDLRSENNEQKAIVMEPPSQLQLNDVENLMACVLRFVS